MDLTSLNERQVEVVTKTEGPVMVLAGAGSGKTRTLVSRIIYLLEDKEISPFKLLALTFSNKAAKEMKERVAAEIKQDIGTLQITTFHSFCARVLRSEANYLGLSRNFTIYDDSESKTVVKSILKRRGISQKDLSPYEILYYIGDIKNSGYSLKSARKEFDTEDELFSYFEEYESIIHKANAVDFGGLITGVLELFSTHPEVLRTYQERFNYILVDEYQDTNRAQFKLVAKLSELHRNICVVGDEDQSIYSWRGADIRNILDFENVFKDTLLIKLEQNYRSSKIIIDAATCVISRNIERKGKNMWTKNSEGEIISVVECEDEKTEAGYVVLEIEKLAGKNEEFRDMAVFYRTNSQSRILEDHLRKRSIPYRIVGGIKFYDRKEIKDILCYIRLVVNAKDSLAFSRVINNPPRGIGAVTLRKLENEAIRSKLSLFELASYFTDNPSNYEDLRLSNKVKSSLSSFVNLIEEGKLLEKNRTSPKVIYEKLLHESGYFEFLKNKRDIESLSRIENLNELSNAISQFEDMNREPTLEKFLETITLDSNNDDEDDKIKEVREKKGEVSLMTVHGAKGLEFPYVFLVGAEENMFPSYRSLDEGENGLEEERRLFYVAMTRAMKKLYILFAQARVLFGQLKFNGPSRFINEIPNDMISWNKKSEQKKSSDFDTFSESQEIENDYEKVYYQVNEEKTSKYPVGCLVAHSLYGEGKIIKTEGLGVDEKVLIKFKDGAVKRFMVRVAPLTHI